MVWNWAFETFKWRVFHTFNIWQIWVKAILPNIIDLFYQTLLWTILCKQISSINWSLLHSNMLKLLYFLNNQLVKLVKKIKAIIQYCKIYHFKFLVHPFYYTQIIAILLQKRDRRDESYLRKISFIEKEGSLFYL